MARKTIIIAEIGENHLGYWDIAARMIEEAAKNGANIAKFQSYLADQVDRNDPDYEWFQKVALPDEKHFEFKRLAEELGIEFMSAPFTPGRCRFLCESLGCRSIKVASSMLADFATLDIINSQFNTIQNVYLSTGMATLDEIRTALKRLNRIGQVVILHCVSQYPCPAEHANLRSIQTLAKEFPGHLIGYSDHTIGLTACLTAVALGATVIEKHFTLSKELPGTDHIGSMTPEELKILGRQIEEVEQLLGSGQKSPIAEELEIRELMRGRFRDNR